MDLYTLESKIKGAPWKLIGLVIFMCFAVVYVAWMFARTKPPQAGAVIQAAPAVTAPKVAGPILKVPLRVVPKPAVTKKFPQIGTIPASEEVIDTADIPPTENGVSTITFLNTSTGTARTEYIPKPAPWFAFEAKNSLTAQVETEPFRRGTANVPIDYQRTIARVKDLHLIAGTGVNIPIGYSPENKFRWKVRAGIRWDF